MVQFNVDLTHFGPKSDIPFTSVSPMRYINRLEGCFVEGFLSLTSLSKQVMSEARLDGGKPMNYPVLGKVMTFLLE